jgi:hypothetical protein
MISGVSLLAGLFTIPSLYLVKQGIYNLHICNPFVSVHVLKTEAHTQYGDIGETARLVQEKYASAIRTNQFTMLSVWDIWYYIMFHSTDTIGSGCLACGFDETAQYVANIKKTKSPLLFIDSDKDSTDGYIANIFNQVSPDYQFIETLGVLDIYERIKP